MSHRIVKLTDEQHKRMSELCAAIPDLQPPVKQAGLFTPATQEQIDAAREIHQCNEVEVDDNAGTSDSEDGTGYWVQGWVWIDTPDDEDEDKGEEG